MEIKQIPPCEPARCVRPTYTYGGRERGGGVFFLFIFIRVILLFSWIFFFFFPVCFSLHAYRVLPLRPYRDLCPVADHHHPLHTRAKKSEQFEPRSFSGGGQASTLRTVLQQGRARETKESAVTGERDMHKGGNAQFAASTYVHEFQPGIERRRGREREGGREGEGGR
jgi:hypothetical protein